MTAADVHAELGEVIAGRKRARESADEIIVFDSTGTGLQDVAAAIAVYGRALQEETGMKGTLPTFALAGAAALSAHAENFDMVKPGSLPAGWECGVTGKGTPRWTVEADPTAPSAPQMLQQSGSGTFPWCVKKDASLADGHVEVKFKALRGRQDQAGGVVWRWKDGDNYYVARANALENNVSLYYTENGRRITLKYVDAPVPANTWHTLAGGIFRRPHPRSAERQDLYRARRRAHQRRRRGRRLDQGRQRDGVRRLSLRRPVIGLLLTARSLRAFADGYVAVLLPAYLLALGYGTIEVGVLSTVTMLGSAAATLAVGRWGHRFELRRMLIAAAALMTVTGVGFAAFSSLWPLLIVALAGTMNPGGGDVSVFYPLEHTALAAAAPAETRTSAFARYSFIGSIFGAVGALAAGGAGMARAAPWRRRCSTR